MQDFFEKKHIHEINVEPEKALAMANGINMITARVYENIKLDYFPDKLKEKLDPELFNEVTSKTYTISDFNGLVELLKEHGITPKQFKKYITVTTNVDKERIKQLYDVGDITQKMLNGCYSAKLVKSIRILERKGGSD